MHQIIAGIDPLPGSRDAATLAAGIAAVTGAQLLLVAVYEDPLLPLRRTDPGRRARPEEAHRLLASVRAACAPDAAVRAVPAYSVALALHEIAAEEDADLLVIGAGRHAATGAVGDSPRGRQILHDAPCPVMIAAAGLRSHDAGLLSRVIVGDDGTPDGAAALDFGREMARAGGAWLDVVRVGEGLDARRELVAAAAGADLLVVGTRGWGVLEPLGLGSTSSYVAAHAPCSVVVVPRSSRSTGPPGRATPERRCAPAARAVRPAP
jgi:nucleotide-binding universal stress UspA family protein